MNIDVAMLIAQHEGISGCARCGGLHESLNWKEFERPVPRQGGGCYLAWATCPTSGDPILFAVIPT